METKSEEELSELQELGIKCRNILRHNPPNPHFYSLCDGIVLPTDTYRCGHRLYVCNKCGGERWRLEDDPTMNLEKYKRFYL